MPVEQPAEFILEVILEDEPWRQPYRSMERFVEENGGWDWFKNLSVSAIRRLEEFDEIVRGWSDDYVRSARNACRAAGIDDDDLCDYIRSQYEDMLIDSARGVRGSSSASRFRRNWNRIARRITIRHERHY